ncbi:MAG: ketoacyl-ACP synthase III [Eubacteriaceae bacterium]|nr:ketoacyl-ACP synthase III [Eubacteriaceae bacterium]
MAGIRILGLGKAQGDRKVTNDDLSKTVDTSDEWIRKKSGIKSRYFAEEKTNLDMAVEAAEKAVKSSGIEKKDIALCIVCTFTSDDYTPGTACGVSGALGLEEEIIAFDLNGACSGFVLGCKMANEYLRTMPDKYALIIGSEKISPVMDMEDRGTCVLFGDGSGAAVVGFDQEAEFSFFGGCIPDRQVLGAKRGGYIEMAGQEVYRFATSKLPQCIDTILERTGHAPEEIDWYVCHQANERIIDTAARRVPREIRDRFFKNLYDYGNTSAASIPIALAEMEEKKMIKPGQKLICTGFGAGLTYGSMLISR